MQRFLQRELAAAVRDAVKLGRASGREICGLLVNAGHVTRLVPIRNRARRAGRFIVDGRQVRAVLDAAAVLGQEVVGTYHSHPLSFAVPGPGDIRGTVNDSLMLIIDCCAREARLWRIKGGKARALRFETMRVAGSRTVVSTQARVATFRKCAANDRRAGAAVQVA